MDTSDNEYDFGSVQKTADYNRFLYMSGNRTVDVKHVKELQTQMDRNREVFASMPILVNENWFIVDGQHRFEAAKGLGLPIYYIRQKRLGLADARQLNIAQKRWGLIDFAKSYADSGRQDYVELLRVNKQYPKIALSIVSQYLAGARSGGEPLQKFRRGEYQIKDNEDGMAALEVLQEVIGMVGRPVNNAMASALWHVLHHEDFDEKTFLRKLKQSPELLNISTSTRQCLRSIEEVFNRHNRIAVRLY